MNENRRFNTQRKQEEPVQESVRVMSDRTNWLKFEIEYSNHELLDYERRDKKNGAIITRRKIEKLREELKQRTGDGYNTTLPSDCPVNVSELFANYNGKRTYSLKLTEEGRYENSLSDDDWGLYIELLNKKIVLKVTNSKHKDYQKIKDRVDFLETRFAKEEKETETRTPYKEDAPF